MRAQSSVASGQRGWKEHPRRLTRVRNRAPDRNGVAAGSSTSTSRASSPRVYGCSGRRRTAAVGPVSTIRPAYMTARWSATDLPDDRQVVTDEHQRDLEPPPEVIEQFEHLRLNGHIEAVVGSSQRRTAGSDAIAIAIVTRWRIPPDSSCGKACARRERLADADEVEQRDAAGPTPDGAGAVDEATTSATWLPTVCTGSSALRASWNTIAIRPRRCRRAGAGRPTPASWPSSETVPESTRAAAGSSPMIARKVRLLPLPDSPTIPSERPGGNRERDAIDDGRRHAAGLTDRERQLADRERRGRDEQRCRPSITAGAGRRRGRRRSARARGRSITTAIPGSVASVQCVVMNSCPSLIIAPQSGVGGWAPSPR